MKVSSSDSYTEDMRYFYENGEEDEGLEVMQRDERNEEERKSVERAQMNVQDRVQTEMRKIDRIPSSALVQERMPTRIHQETVKRESRKNKCQFCQWKILEIKFLRENLHIRYFDEFNFYFAKPINEILSEDQLPHVIAFKDFRFYDDTHEYLKRYYRVDEVPPRIAVLTNFFTFSYKPTRPNLIITKMNHIIQKRNFRQTRLFLRLIKRNPNVSAAIQRENLNYNNEYKDDSSESEPSSLTTPKNNYPPDDPNLNTKHVKKDSEFKVLNSRLSSITHLSQQDESRNRNGQQSNQQSMTEEQKQRALEYENYRNVILKISFQSSTHDIYYPSVTSSMRNSLKNVQKAKNENSIPGQFRQKHEEENDEEEKKSIEEDEEEIETPLKLRSDMLLDLIMGVDKQKSPLDIQKIAEQITSSQQKRYNQLLDIEPMFDHYNKQQQLQTNSSLNSLKNNQSSSNNPVRKLSTSKRMSTYISQSNSLSNTFDPGNYILNATAHHENHKKTNPVLTNPSDLPSDRLQTLKSPTSNLTDRIMSPFPMGQIDFNSQFQGESGFVGELKENLKQTSKHLNGLSVIKDNQDNNNSSTNAIPTTSSQEENFLFQQKLSSTNSIQQIQKYILSQIKKHQDANSLRQQNKSSFNKLHTSLSPASKSKERKDQESQRTKQKDKEQKNNEKFPLTKSGNISSYRKQLNERNFTEVNLGSVFEQLKLTNRLASLEAKKALQTEQDLPNNLESYLLKLGRENKSRNNSSKKRKSKHAPPSSNTLFSASTSPLGFTPRDFTKKPSITREQIQASRNIINTESSPPPTSARGVRKSSQATNQEKKSILEGSSGNKLTSPSIQKDQQSERVASPLPLPYQNNNYPVKHSSQGMIGKSFQGANQNQFGQQQHNDAQQKNSLEQYQQKSQRMSSSSAKRGHSNLNIRSKVLTTNSTSNENKSSIHSPAPTCSEKEFKNSKLKSSISPPQAKQVKLIPAQKRGSYPKPSSPSPNSIVTPQQQTHLQQTNTGKQTQTQVLQNNYFQQQMKSNLKSDDTHISPPLNQGSNINLHSSQNNPQSESSHSNSQLTQHQYQQQQQLQAQQQLLLLQSQQQQQLLQSQSQLPPQQSSTLPFSNQILSLQSLQGFQSQQRNEMQRQISPIAQNPNAQNGTYSNLLPSNYQTIQSNGQIHSNLPQNASPLLKDQVQGVSTGSKINKQLTQRILTNALTNTINKFYQNMTKENLEGDQIPQYPVSKSSSSHQYPAQIPDQYQQYQIHHQQFQQHLQQQQQMIQQQQLLYQQQLMQLQQQHQQANGIFVDSISNPAHFQTEPSAQQIAQTTQIQTVNKSNQNRNGAPALSARQQTESKLKEQQISNATESNKLQKRLANNNQALKSKKKQLLMRQKVSGGNNQNNEANSLTGLASNQSINTSFNHHNYSHNNFNNNHNNTNIHHNQTNSSNAMNNNNNQFLSSINKLSQHKNISTQASNSVKQVTNQPQLNNKQYLLQQLQLSLQKQQQLQSSTSPFILPLHQLNSNTLATANHCYQAMSGSQTDRTDFNPERLGYNSERTFLQSQIRSAVTPKPTQSKINQTLTHSQHNQSLAAKLSEQSNIANIPKEYRTIKTEANAVQTEESQVLYPSNSKILSTASKNYKSNGESQIQSNLIGENYHSPFVHQQQSQQNLLGYPSSSLMYQSQVTNSRTNPNDLLIPENIKPQQNSGKKKIKNSVISATPVRNGADGKQRLDRKREDASLNNNNNVGQQSQIIGGSSSVHYSPPLQFHKDDQELGSGFYTHRNPPQKNRKKSNDHYTQGNLQPNLVPAAPLSSTTKYIQSIRGSYQGNYSDISAWKYGNASQLNHAANSSPPRQQSPPIFNSQYQIHSSQSQSQLMQQQQQLLTQPANSSTLSQHNNASQAQGGLSQQQQVAGLLNHKIKQLSQKIQLQ